MIKPDIRLIPAGSVSSMWGAVSPRLASVASSSHGKVTVADLEGELVSGRMQLWLVGDRAVVITEFADYPRLRVCRIVACVGEGLKDWLHLIANIERWAVEQGCGAMQLFARKGYRRMLAPFRYTQTHVVLEKEL